jgi:hypothetical protein
MAGKRVLAVGSSDPLRLIDLLRKRGELNKSKIELKEKIYRTAQGVYIVADPDQE